MHVRWMQYTTSVRKLGDSRKNATYCNAHKPMDYVDIVSKRCTYDGCNIKPVYGKLGDAGKNATYCNAHKPVDYVDVVHKRCMYDGCKSRPSYGKLGDAGKNATYCNAHKPVDYVNVVSKRCIYNNCETRPNYGLLFGNKIHCSRHKKLNEYKFNNPTCETLDCKERPFYTDNVKINYPKRCDIHKLCNDINIVEKKCVNCGLMFYLNKISLCNDCNEYINSNVNVRKEIIIKEHLQDKFILYDIHDKIPSNSCYKYRPDFVWDFVSHICILEVDENQHNTYQCECEQSRMINITQDFGGIPVVWIRFNPDRYIGDNGKKFGTV